MELSVSQDTGVPGETARGRAGKTGLGSNPSSATCLGGYHDAARGLDIAKYKFLL